MISRFRTPKQMEALARATSVGYEHSRDSEYRVTTREGVRRGCMIILFGNVTGSARSMIIYPDGSVVTAPRKRGGSTSVNYDKRKLIDALHSDGDLLPAVARIAPIRRSRRRRVAAFLAARSREQQYADEDEVFQIEGGQR